MKSIEVICRHIHTETVPGPVQPGVAFPSQGPGVREESASAQLLFWGVRRFRELEGLQVGDLRIGGKRADAGLELISQSESAPIAFRKPAFSNAYSTNVISCVSGSRITRSNGNDCPAASRSTTFCTSGIKARLVLSMSHKSTVSVRRGTNFGVKTNPPLKERESSGWKSGCFA